MNPKDKILGIRLSDIEKQGYDVLKLYKAAREDYKTMPEGQVTDDLQQRFGTPHTVAKRIAMSAFSSTLDAPETVSQLSRDIVQGELEGLGDLRNDPELCRVWRATNSLESVPRRRSTCKSASEGATDESETEVSG